MPTGITVTSPSDWVLVDAWTLTSDITAARALEGGHPVSEPAGLPILQLSNVDLGLGPLCDPDRPLPTDAASLYIGYDVNAMGAVGGSAWPVEPESADGPCGRGYYARWTTSGGAYIGFAEFGPAASAPDRATLLGAFHGLRFEPVEMSGRGGWDWAGYVVANGLSAATPWNVEARPTPDDAELRLIAPTDPGFNSGSVSAFRVPDGMDVESIGFAFPSGSDADLVTFGAITDAAVRVTVGDKEAAFVAMPPSFDLPFQVFLGQVRLAAPDPVVIAVVKGFDAAGNVVVEGDVAAQVRPFDTAEPPSGAFEWCPNMDGVLPPSSDAEIEASDVALRFAQAFLSGDDRSVTDLTDPSSPLDATWQITGSADTISVLAVKVGGDSLVQTSCDAATAEPTVAVQIDDGTSSASLDFTLYLVLRKDGWHVWGSY